MLVSLCLIHVELEHAPACVIKLIAGEVDQSDQNFLDDEQLAEGYALLCVSYPKTDVVIKPDVEDEAVLNWDMTSEIPAVIYGVVSYSQRGQIGHSRALVQHGPYDNPHRNDSGTTELIRSIDYNTGWSYSVSGHG